MKAFGMIAAIGAATALSGNALAAGEMSAAPQTTTAGAPSGLLIERHVSEEKARQQALTFFDENGKRAGVITLPSGLQYQVIKAGTGSRPAVGSMVRLNYTGTLLDGTEFGRSNLNGNGNPAEFALGRLIPGLREAVGQMQQGAKWRIYVPPQLGYDLHNPLFRKVTVFDVELVAVTEKTAASGADASAHGHQVVGLR